MKNIQTKIKKRKKRKKKINTKTIKIIQKKTKKKILIKPKIFNQKFLPNRKTLQFSSLFSNL